MKVSRGQSLLPARHILLCEPVPPCGGRRGLALRSALDWDTLPPAAESPSELTLCGPWDPTRGLLSQECPFPGTRPAAPPATPPPPHASRDRTSLREAGSWGQPSSHGWREAAGRKASGRWTAGSSVPGGGCRVPRCGKGGSGRPSAFVHWGLWARARVRGSNHPGPAAGLCAAGPIWRTRSSTAGFPGLPMGRGGCGVVGAQPSPCGASGWVLSFTGEFLPNAWGSLLMGKLTCALH